MQVNKFFVFDRTKIRLPHSGTAVKPHPGKLFGIPGLWKPPFLSLILRMIKSRQNILHSHFFCCKLSDSHDL